MQSTVRVPVLLWLTLVHRVKNHDGVLLRDDFCCQPIKSTSFDRELDLIISMVTSAQ